MSGQLDSLIACLKSLKREEEATRRAAEKSADLYAGYSDSQQKRYAETARICAVQVRRLKHEAHCLAVEAGIADLRDDAHYTPVTAPAGFGRDTVIERRRPHA